MILLARLMVNSYYYGSRDRGDLYHTRPGLDKRNSSDVSTGIYVSSLINWTASRELPVNRALRNNWQSRVRGVLILHDFHHEKLVSRIAVIAKRQRFIIVTEGGSHLAAFVRKRRRSSSSVRGN